MNELKESNEKEAKESEPLPTIRREIKTYVLRAGRMTVAQQKAYNELAPSWCIPFEEKKLNFVDIFGNTNPIVIEIGFGMGDATVAIAQANPDINYLGIYGIGKNTLIFCAISITFEFINRKNGGKTFVGIRNQVKYSNNGTAR